MGGHVRKRGNAWAIVYDEGIDEKRKRRQRWRSGYPTRRAAEDALNGVLDKLARGGYVTPRKVTVEKFLMNEWLPTRESKLRPGSFATYQSMLRNQIVPRLGNRQLQALAPADLNVFFAELERAGLAAATRQLIFAILSKALRDAARWDRIARNPLTRVDPPKASGRRATAWTAHELSRFLAAVATDRLFALWRLGATTGARRGELLGLAWRSVDLQGGRVTIERQLLASGAFGPPKSARSERTIRLDGETVAALERHRDAQRVERALAGDAYEDCDLVFCDELGRPILPQRISDRFVSQRNAAGLSTGTLHVLRHSAATLMLTNGIPIHVVAARLGDKAETILKTYAHLLAHSDEQAALDMAELIATAR